MLESIYFLNNYPVIQLKSTDLDGKADSLYKFSLQKSPKYLTINETTGEVHFHHDKWNQEKQKQLIAVVKNVDSEAIAKTSMTINFLVTEKESFCLRYSCFYDNILYKTTEFNMRKSNQEQVIGDVQPLIYRRICENMQMNYHFENGEIVFKTLKAFP